MKTRPLPPSLLVVLAAVLLGAALPLSAAPAPSQTDAKIRLMAEALRARDAGDLAGAQAALNQLATVSPNDPAVQKLRAEVEASAVARQNARAQEAAVVAKVAAEPAPKMIDVRIPEPGQTPPAGPSAAEIEADAMARAETARQTQLIATGQTQLANARRQLREGRAEDAVATVDAAIAALPANALTQKLIADLKKEKASALLDRAQAALRRGDTAAARLAMAEQAQLAPAASTRAEGLERQISRAETTPARPGVDPAFAADRAATAQMIAKGRAQYVAGDLDGAQGTFRAVEAQEPDNTIAKGFLLRIAEEKAETGALNREKTRAQLLEEVAKSWQRPGIYQERPRETNAAEAVAPLQRKITEIVLPAVSWTRAPIGEVVASLSAISEEFDTAAAAGTAKGVNVVLVDPSNKNPSVTITLRNMSLKRVLDLVTEQIGYQYEVQADALVVRPGGETSTLETQFFPVTRATVLRMSGIGGGGAGKDPYAAGGAGTEPAVTGGEASSMRAFLQQAGVSFTVEGSSLAYDGSAIIVTQTARNNERIRNILARYNDVRQVEIEAKFMEVQEGALEELGVTWNLSRRGVPRVNPATGAPVLDTNGRQIFDPRESYTTNNINRSLLGAFPSSSTSNALVIKDPAITNSVTDPNQTAGQLRVPVAPTTIPGAVQLAATAGALASIVGFVGEFDVTAAIRALSQRQGTDLLSSPKLTVLSGNPANITVAQELRYPQSYGEIQSQVGTGAVAGGAAGVTITAGTPQEFTSRNVGVELKVTPTVEEDDYSISLDLNPKVTEFEGFVEYGGPSVAISGTTTVTVPPGFYQPIFSVRDISTKVTIWDGATLVMGGLTREEVKKVNDKVPFFGDLPFVGRLFRTKGESSQKRNLLIFVTANLVSPGGSPKKQSLKNTPANSLFQNPTIVTPASAEPRTRNGGK